MGGALWAGEMRAGCIYALRRSSMLVVCSGPFGPSVNVKYKESTLTRKHNRLGPLSVKRHVIGNNNEN